MTTITVTFDPPVPSDSTATFNTKAFSTLGDLNTWSGQANTVAGEVNTNASTASTASGTATTQAGIATSAASTATTQAGIATTQAGLATAAYDSFDDRYLGSKSSNPTLDNDGAALLTGALYWNSVSSEMRAWNGSAWVTLTTISGTTISANSASAALTVTQTGTGWALVVEDSASPDSTPFVVDANGTVLIGYPTQLTVAGAGAKLQGAGTGQEANSALVRYTDTAGQSPNLGLGRARGTTVGTNTIVQSGDNLGAINFAGGDGAALISAGQIKVEVDGTPGTNDMPGRLVFSTTADGASSPTERMRIDSAGKVTGSASYVAHSATAIPAGGTAGAGLMVSSTANFGVFFGSGAPTLSAAKGSLYLRSDGSTTNDRMYINTNGSTTWTAVTTAA